MMRLLLLSILLTGCAGNAVKPDPAPHTTRAQAQAAAPTVVERVVEVPLKLSAEQLGLFADCYNEPAKEATYNEAKRVANLRDASIKECNGRLAKGRALLGGGQR